MKSKNTKPSVNETMLQEMAKQLMYLSNIMDSSPDIIVVTDLKKRIINFSKSGEKNLGQDHEGEVQGRWA